MRKLFGGPFYCIRTRSRLYLKIPSQNLVKKVKTWWVCKFETDSHITSFIQVYTNISIQNIYINTKYINAIFIHTIYIELQ